MEKKILVTIVLLVAGLLGVGHLFKPVDFQGFRQEKDDSLRAQFKEFQWTYEKVYNDIEEENKRFEIFKYNTQRIEQFNKEGHSSTVGMNFFGDLSDEEYQKYLTLDVSLQPKKQYSTKVITNRAKKVDWVGTLVWTGVNNQGDCGSCWAFSTVQGLEGAYAKEYGKFQLLSVQEILDCAEDEFGNKGCNGGLMDPAFKWVMKYGGICARDEYPRQYVERQEKCEENSCTATLKNINGYYDVKEKSKEDFLNHLAIVPLSVAIDANQFAFQFYFGGIIHTKSFKALDHGVLAVGYDESSSNESERYIKGKNSWGKRWGDKGYFKLQIFEDGNGCLGIYKSASYPTYPSEPTTTLQ